MYNNALLINVVIMKFELFQDHTLNDVSMERCDNKKKYLLAKAHFAKPYKSTNVHCYTFMNSLLYHSMPEKI